MYRAVGVVRDAGHASENVVKGGILALRDGVDLLTGHCIGARPYIRADLKPALLESRLPLLLLAPQSRYPHQSATPSAWLRARRARCRGRKFGQGQVPLFPPGYSNCRLPASLELQ